MGTETGEQDHQEPRPDADPSQPIPLPERTYRAMNNDRVFYRAWGRLNHLRGILVEELTPAEQEEEKQIHTAWFRQFYDPI